MRFLIVDDHALVRRGIIAALQQQETWQVVAVEGSMSSGLQKLAELEVDVAIIDLGLPDGSGLEFIERALEISPNLKILVSSMRDETVFAPRCVALGARGYVAKHAADGVLKTAIERILDGELYLSDAASGIRVDRRPHHVGTPAGMLSPRFDSLAKLSNRELSVFELIGRGFSTREIANRLSVKTKTVDSFRERIKNKLELGSSSELLQHATRWTVASEDGS